MAKKEMILASGSEQRRRILAECGVRFRVVKTGAPETAGGGGDIREIVTGNARKKAEAAAGGFEPAVVVGADTLALFGGSVIGKVSSAGEAKKLLRSYSGGRLEVFTGLYVLDREEGRAAGGWESTGVAVRKLEESEIERYVQRLGPFDRAGGFSIEGAGALVFDNIAGSYYNVLGLPVMKLARLLEEIGLSIFSFMED